MVQLNRACSWPPYSSRIGSLKYSFPESTAPYPDFTNSVWMDCAFMWVSTPTRPGHDASTPEMSRGCLVAGPIEKASPTLSAKSIVISQRPPKTGKRSCSFFLRIKSTRASAIAVNERSSPSDFSVLPQIPFNRCCRDPTDDLMLKPWSRTNRPLRSIGQTVRSLK
jgi:hypothetical protein